jgi:hypothetical protein
VWKTRPPEELVDSAIRHLELATLIKYGKSPLQDMAVCELDLKQAASELNLAADQGLKDLGKLKSKPDCALLLEREDVSSKIKELKSRGTPSDGKNK